MYLLICQHCGLKHHTENGKELTEIASAPPTGSDKNIRRFKCYNCGYLFKINKMPEPPKKPSSTEMPPQEENFLENWEKECLKSTRKS